MNCNPAEVEVNVKQKHLTGRTLLLLKNWWHTQKPTPHAYLTHLHKFKPSLD